MDDSKPEEGEIIKALMRMKNGKSPGLTGITVEDMKEWYNLTYKLEGDKDEEAEEKWKLLVKIVQSCIEGGEIPTAFMYGILDLM